MYPIIYLYPNKEHKIYNEFSFISKFKDRFKIRLTEENFIKDLDLDILKIKFPLNLDYRAYSKNISIAKKIGKDKKVYVAPNIWSKLDYNIYNEFQKELFGYTLAKTIKLLLRVNSKSIKKSCITIYDPADKQMFECIKNISKIARHIVFLTHDINKSRKISEYVIANYGISPTITQDSVYAFNNTDFILTSKNIVLNNNIPIWYFDNRFKPNNSNTLSINQVTCKTCFEYPINKDVSVSLIGAILSQMGEHNMDKLFKENKVFIDKIKFNNEIINIK